MAARRSKVAARNGKESIDGAAARARLSAILEGIRAAGDAERLDEARSLFRSAVPLHLRAYVAAAMLLEALDRGEPRGRRDGAGRDSRREEGRKRGKDAAGAREPRQDAPKARQAKEARDEPRREPKAERPPLEELPEARIKEGRLTGEGVTLFVGMGRRQRMNARSLYRLLSDLTGLEEDQVGEVRSRDNYSFVEVAPDAVEAVIAALDGAAVRGRRLTVSLARKRDERNADSGTGADAEDASERRVAFIDADSDAAEYEDGDGFEDGSGTEGGAETDPDGDPD